MLAICSTVNTIVKKKPVQSSELPPEDKRGMLVASYLRVTNIEVADNNHWKIVSEQDGSEWYVFRPHWNFFWGKSLSQEQLLSIFEIPYVNPFYLRYHYPYLQIALAKAEINTNARIAYFLAQIGHESGGFRYLEEIASGQAYEGRRDLGNVQPGDGVRYKGRGLIQITGRHNYTIASKALGVDFVANPLLAGNYRYASDIACWYWTSRNLNHWADLGDFKKVTLLINGGFNGMSDRLRYLEKALKVFPPEKVH